MRYLVGNIKKDSIETLAVGPQQMKLQDMAKPPLAEHPVRVSLPSRSPMAPDPFLQHCLY